MPRLTIRNSSLSAGLLLITIWTLVRSFNNGVNFDVVGQIGVANQWLHGSHAGAQLGATNYLLKIPIYMLANSLQFLGSHVVLIGLALLFNVVTYILLFLLFEKLLKLYNVTPNRWFYLAMVWLASISSHVFWLDYANSRNLEVVGGVLVLYLGLKLFKERSLRPYVYFALISGIVFFADQLQLYAIGGGLILYAVLLAIYRRSKAQLRQSAYVIGTIIAGAVIGRVVLLVATKLLPVSFLVAPKAPPYASLQLVTTTARLFDSNPWATPSGPNMLRQLLCAALLIAMLISIAYCWRRSRNKQLAAALLCCMFTSYVAYIASGQAQLPNTERYLIMVPLLLVPLWFATTTNLKALKLRSVFITTTVVLVLSSLLAAGALAISWPQRFSKDAHITATLSFLQQHHFRYAATSRDAIVANYFASGKQTIVPLICVPDHTLVASNLFFDKADFAKLHVQKSVLVPLIVPAGGIVSSGVTCDITAIEQQLGPPAQILPVSGVGTALVYPASQLPLQI